MFQHCGSNQCTKMGIYRILVCMYYSKKNFVIVGLVLAALMMVYFYLPYVMGPKPGSSYLNPRVNKMIQKPHIPESHDADLNISKMKLIKVPDYLTELHKCPACFGKDICEDIETGAIQMIQPEEDDMLKIKGVYNAYWNKQPVVIKRLNKAEEYAKVDMFLCKNASMESGCDVSKAILSSQAMAQHEKVFNPDFLRNAWKIMHERSDQLAVAACLTEDAIRTLSEEFDTNDDDQLSAENKAMFFTSLVLNPESLFLQFAKIQGLKIHFPEVLGHCGRIVVTEHAGQPLSTFIQKSFKERADIALMLLGMIFFLQNFSTKWSLVFSDFNFDNFYVKDDNLYIVDAEDMLVTDTEFYAEPKVPHSEICNAECFEKFSLRLFNYADVKREDICPLTPRITEQAMYALACERILSYMPEHHKFSPYEGLLHDPPEEIRHILETALRECVTETANDGRISSIDIISELLEKYTDYGNYHYNDDMDGDDGKDEHKNMKIDGHVEAGNAGDQAQNPGVANQVQNQRVANQTQNQGVANQAQNPEVPNQAQIEGVANQAQKPEVANQAPNPGVANQAQKPEVANQAQKPEVPNQAQNQGVANQAQNPEVPNQAQNPEMANQAQNPKVVSQVQNQGVPNQAQNQGVANQAQNPEVANQAQNPEVPNQAQNPEVPNQAQNQAVVGQPRNQGL